MKHKETIQHIVGGFFVFRMLNICDEVAILNNGKFIMKLAPMLFIKISLGDLRAN